jgi:hypothetical protein
MFEHQRAFSRCYKLLLAFGSLPFFFGAEPSLGTWELDSSRAAAGGGCSAAWARHTVPYATHNCRCEDRAVYDTQLPV